MRAIVCQAFAKPESLILAEVAPLASPRRAEVVIDVAAAGVNFADNLMVAGQYQVKPALPFSPGFEAAGKVRACGTDVTRVRPGDRVLAVADHGGFAEQMLAQESNVIPIPEAMDFATAASFAIAYGTSHGALRWRANLQPGEVLLVHGAAGGVGLTAVEIGKAIGAVVIATASTAKKLAIAKLHGADHLIDSSRDDIRDRVKEICQGRGADVVYDPIGGGTFDASLRCMNWNGRIVIVGFAGGKVPQIPANILLVKNIAALGFYWGSYRQHRPDLLREEFEERFEWWRAGKLKPHVSEQFELSQAAEALRLLSERKSTGKVVLTTGLAVD
ncbi:MAG: NADPH:quinone oxidoreductase family protein [Dongiaceae bacterium]